MFASSEVLTEKYDERFSLLCLDSPFAPGISHLSTLLFCQKDKDFQLSIFLSLTLLE